MIERYYLKADHQTEWDEVTREQFIAAEQAAGFRSKFGPDHPATGGFTGKGMRGRVEYIIDDNDHDTPAAPERSEHWTCSRENDGYYYVRKPGVIIARTGNESDAITVATALNQHSTLITQRERLLTALKQCVSFIESNDELAKAVMEPHVIRLAHDAITTSEQEERRR